ncbi:MAG: exodeoxyribonuclease [Alphaproteobacteria bacterium]|jgi:exodeoxyribonuclease VII small subunit|nr:exodeoxyribonuclease [Alphaproteobacteria bacterium]MDF3034666.1 exodeoxyribonuclease [Alphaproteobacteria bacterium]
MTDFKETALSSETPTDIKDMSFEKAMAELELLVRRLEEGRLTLEDAIGAYERGTALRTHCEAKLRVAKLKVEQVLGSQNTTSG